MKNRCITTPIFYANSVPHLGHLYSVVLADVWARSSEILNEKPILFVSGLDEHGQKVFEAAKRQNLFVKDHVDNICMEFLEFFGKFNVISDIWMRTTNEDHKQLVQQIWADLQEKGYIYKSYYEGFYSISEETYLTDVDNEEMTKLAMTNKNIVFRKEECYYFKLSAFEEKLLNFFDENPDFIYPKKRYNEAVGFIKQGLKDFVISRPKDRLIWGIDVPNDNDQVVYVWFDALINYLSALKYPDKKYEKTWKNTIHILGKDILKFHAIYWIAMLIGAEIPVPQKLVVHGWWMNGENKISKSLNNATPIQDLIPSYSSDGIRYFLLKGLKLGEDVEFSEKYLRTIVYSELADKYGNLLARLLGVLKMRVSSRRLRKTRNLNDENLTKKFENCVQSLKSFNADITKINDYVESWLDLVNEMNLYFSKNEIWKIDDQFEISNQLYYLLDMFKKSTILISPILPKTAKTVGELFCINCTFDYMESPLPDNYDQFNELLFTKHFNFNG